MTLRIDDFKAALIGGGARPNYFRVIPSFPGGVTSTDNTGLGLVQLGSFVIKGAQLPPSTIGEIPVPFRGRQLKVAGDRIFEDWTITIMNDNNFAIRNAFESWMNQINQHVGGTTSLGTNIQAYIQDWRVEQLDKNNDVQKTYTFRGCFPVQVDPIDMSFDATDTIEEFSCTIAYQYWTSNTTDNVG